MELYAKMIPCLVLLFVVLKIREEDKMFLVDAIYVDGDENVVDDKWYKQPLDKLYDTWETMVTDAVGQVSRSCLEVIGYILENLGQALADGKAPECEMLERLDRGMEGGLTTTKNETKNYNVSVHRCGTLSIL